MVKVKALEVNQYKDLTETFVVAFSLLLFEIFLSRIFSIILEYNYVFLVISFSTLGLGFGAYYAFNRFQQFNKLKKDIIFLFPLSILLVTFIIYSFSFLNIFIYLFLGTVPFIFGGYILSGILQDQHSNAHRVYFADLLGAGIGAVASILLMNILNPIKTIEVVTFTTAFILFISEFNTQNNKFKIINGVVLVSLLLNLFISIFNYVEFRAFTTSPYTTFYSQQDAEIVYSQWNAFARTDVYDAGDELLYITIDGHAVSPITPYFGDLDEIDYLLKTTASLAFLGEPNNKALIIGSGGGQEVLTAKLKGFNQIDAVDINKGTFDAIYSLSDKVGNIYQSEGVNEIRADGRSYIRNTDENYDLIYLSLVIKQSESSPGLTLSENFIYTQEALSEYMNKLNSNGSLAYLLHDEIELNKIVYAAEKHLKEIGIQEENMKKHIAVISSYQHLGHVVAGMGGTILTRPLVIIKNEPFTKEMANKLLKTSETIQQIPVHVPYLFDNYDKLTRMFEAQEVDVHSNTDDRPFFYFKKTMIPMFLIFSLLITIIVALFFIKRGGVAIRPSIYFSGLAVGFILIEVSLIQKLILILGHPTLSFVVVLSVLLLSGAVGSLLAKYWSPVSRKRYVPLLLVGLMTTLFVIIIGKYDHLLLGLSESYRIIVTTLMLFPIGFFIGMPFPYGIMKIKRNQTAIFWALNGIMTVAGAFLAPIISLTLGLTFTVISGALIYILLFIFQPIFRIK